MRGDQAAEATTEDHHLDLAGDRLAWFHRKVRISCVELFEFIVGLEVLLLAVGTKTLVALEEILPVQGFLIDLGCLRWGAGLHVNVLG